MLPLFFFALPPFVHAHIAAWSAGMYCLNVRTNEHLSVDLFAHSSFQGTTGVDNQNTNDAVSPVYQLPKSEWWSELLV
jgi:hypothetical protein